MRHPTAAKNRKRLQGFVRENSANPTNAEMQFGKILAAMYDGKVVWQQIIKKFLIDFYLPDLMLAFEVDGAYHNNLKQAYRDINRTDFLDRKGIKVVRIKNELVLNCDSCGKFIFGAISVRQDELAGRKSPGHSFTQNIEVSGGPRLEPASVKDKRLPV